MTAGGDDMRVLEWRVLVLVSFPVRRVEEAVIRLCLDRLVLVRCSS